MGPTEVFVLPSPDDSCSFLDIPKSFWYLLDHVEAKYTETYANLGLTTRQLQKIVGKRTSRIMHVLFLPTRFWKPSRDEQCCFGASDRFPWQYQRSARSFVLAWAGNCLSSLCDPNFLLFIYSQYLLYISRLYNSLPSSQYSIIITTLMPSVDTPSTCTTLGWGRKLLKNTLN